eukprot:CAMPEP_0117443988 /NCGR_PEP_ID=MMETSP0759-20121206/4995_1 /TAXON_ID=63605 /ORGANISM="Percolomonas cosmopolitus, Strain WS" /LENGTH=568 /DNA_ID=CAMNT_0005236013 /DNA_START=196 /DNA_END=1899 /DNA_ORIENTATION=-
MPSLYLSRNPIPSPHFPAQRLPHTKKLSLQTLEGIAQQLLISGANEEEINGGAHHSVRLSLHQTRQLIQSQLTSSKKRLKAHGTHPLPDLLDEYLYELYLVKGRETELKRRGTNHNYPSGGSGTSSASRESTTLTAPSGGIVPEFVWRSGFLLKECTGGSDHGSGDQHGSVSSHQLHHQASGSGLSASSKISTSSIFKNFTHKRRNEYVSGNQLDLEFIMVVWTEVWLLLGGVNGVVSPSVLGMGNSGEGGNADNRQPVAATTSGTLSLPSTSQRTNSHVSTGSTDHLLPHELPSPLIPLQTPQESTATIESYRKIISLLTYLEECIEKHYSLEYYKMLPEMHIEAVRAMKSYCTGALEMMALQIMFQTDLQKDEQVGMPLREIANRCMCIAHLFDEAQRNMNRLSAHMENIYHVQMDDKLVLSIVQYRIYFRYLALVYFAIEHHDEMEHVGDACMLALTAHRQLQELKILVSKSVSSSPILTKSEITDHVYEVEQLTARYHRENVLIHRAKIRPLDEIAIRLQSVQMQPVQKFNVSALGSYLMKQQQKQSTDILLPRQLSSSLLPES